MAAARCPPSPLSLPTQQGKWRKYGERLMGQDKDRERSLSNYHHGHNRLNLGKKNNLIYYQSNQRIMRNKN